MGKLNSFKDQYSIDERIEDSKNIISKYPDRVPIIIERYSRTDLPEMEKKKFLVPRDMSVGQFIHILSSRLHLTPGKALFVFIKNTLPQQPVLWTPYTNLTRMMTGFCICVTAVRKPLANIFRNSSIMYMSILRSCKYL